MSAIRESLRIESGPSMDSLWPGHLDSCVPYECGSSEHFQTWHHSHSGHSGLSQGPLWLLSDPGDNLSCIKFNPSSKWIGWLIRWLVKVHPSLTKIENTKCEGVGEEISLETRACTPPAIHVSLVFARSRILRSSHFHNSQRIGMTKCNLGNQHECHLEKNWRLADMCRRLL